DSVLAAHIEIVGNLNLQSVRRYGKHGRLPGPNQDRGSVEVSWQRRSGRLRFRSSQIRAADQGNATWSQWRARDRIRVAESAVGEKDRRLVRAHAANDLRGR